MSCGETGRPGPRASGGSELGHERADELVEVVDLVPELDDAPGEAAQRNPITPAVERWP
jgi:hypothetical protein